MRSCYLSSSKSTFYGDVSTWYIPKITSTKTLCPSTHFWYYDSPAKMAKMWIISGQLPPRLATRAGHGPDGWTPHQYRWADVVWAPSVLSWLRDGLLWGFGCFSLTSCCSWQPHSASWAWTSACSPTGALVHCCFLSNLSTTTQGAIVKLHGASPELWGRGVRQRVMYTLDYYQCWAVKPRLSWSVNCPGVYWEEGRGGWRVLGSQEVGTRWCNLNLKIISPGNPTRRV